MKRLILIADGSGDWPIPSLGGKTPLEAADIVNINRLAQISEVGLVKTIPDSVAPGSDAANLAILGYDPAVCLTGRAPLEAAAMGLEILDNETAFRVNLITLKGNGQYEELLLKDHSAGEISNGEAEILIEYIDRELGQKDMRFYFGISYRNLLITDKLNADRLTPPHDVLNQVINENLPQGDGSEKIREIMRQSYELLKNHPLNEERVKSGLNPANSIWIWGQGKKPKLAALKDKYGVTGSVVAAVNLIKGIGICAGLNSINIPGADGTLRTNYEGKAAGAIKEFEKGNDFVFVHVEAPDECSHNGDLKGKIKAIENIDEKVLKPLAQYLENTGEPFRILIITDHKTPLKIRTHSAEPVPFVLYDSESGLPAQEWKAFSEASGERGIFFKSGCELADYFFR